MKKKEKPQMHQMNTDGKLSVEGDKRPKAHT
jgi:hypothetical protein